MVSTSLSGIVFVDLSKIQAVLRGAVQWMRLEREKRKWRQVTEQTTIRTELIQMAKNWNNTILEPSVDQMIELFDMGFNTK